MPTIYNKVTAGGQTLIDLSQDTVTSAAHIVTGHTGHLADGTQVAGTGGGSGGLVYESGTYTPASNVAQPTISFANAHSTEPCCVIFSDVTGTAQNTANSEMAWYFVSHYDAFGAALNGGGSTTYYGIRRGYYRGSSTTLTASGGTLTSQTSDYVSSSGFTPSNGNGYYWRAGRTYKWIAVWAPTS